MNSNDVFFLLGSVRSGTTLLRNLLKQHPNLTCPEETHFFRWAEPFNSNDFNHVNENAEVLKMHRKLDGVNHHQFSNILIKSVDRSDCLIRYLEAFKKKNQSSKLRCFEKTPQNVYGLPLIKSYFPKAKIIHIVRNPLNVISSLKKGRGLNPQNIIGAINFWKEALLIINTLKPILKDNLYELKYEDLTCQPEFEFSKLLNFLNEKPHNISDIQTQVRAERNLYKLELTSEEIDFVKMELNDLMNLYSY